MNDQLCWLAKQLSTGFQYMSLVIPYRNKYIYLYDLTGRPSTMGVAAGALIDDRSLQIFYCARWVH